MLRLVCEDLDGDGSREVICATHDTRVHVFSPSGEVEHRIDMQNTKASGPNSLSLYADASEKRGLLVGTYYHAHQYDLFGKSVQTASMRGFYIDAIPPVASDVTEDGTSDFFMPENVRGQVSLIDGASLQRSLTLLRKKADMDWR